MSSNYRQLAKMIVDNVGGIENIDSLHHCQTRLRFKLKDTQKANKDNISKSKDVLKVVISGGQFQVVIGMQVADVYDAVEDYIKSKDGSTIQKKNLKILLKKKRRAS
jgi:Phosphotransferase system IIB components